MTGDTRPEFQFVFPASVVSLLCLSRKGKQKIHQKLTPAGKETKEGLRKKQTKKPNEPTGAHTNCPENNVGKGRSTEPCSSQKKPRQHTKERCGLVLCRILPPSDDNPASGEPCSWKWLREAQTWCRNQKKPVHLGNGCPFLLCDSALSQCL